MESPTETKKGARDRGALGRHSWMLASLVLLLVALPILEWMPGHGLRFPLLVCLVLLAAIYVNSTRRWMMWAAIGVGGGAVAGLAVHQATGESGPRIVFDLLALGLLGFTTILMLNSLVKAHEVDLDTVVGGISVYLLFGLWFAVVYRLLIDFDPGAVTLGGGALDGASDDPSTLPANLLYFSFVTLTTVGYGDMLPKVEAARMVAAAESIVGQLYLTIFIARLMALYVARDRD